MPPHSSHLLQPLDVSCFAVLKRLYGRGVEELVRAGTYHIDKPDFLSIYRVARTSTMVKNTICNGFATTGLVPYNPDQVLSKLHTQLHTPTPPLLSPNLLPWVPETPHNTYEADQQTQTIKASIKRRTNVLSSPTAIALDQLVKGCKMAMQSATVLAEENRRLRAESERQKKKKTVRRQYIATGGVLTGQEGRELIQNSDNMVLDEAVAPLIEPRIRAPRTCSLFWYGWTAENGKVPIIGTAITGCGIIVIWISIQAYLVDAFTTYAVSAVAANTIIRSFFGAFLPLAGQPLYDALGLVRGNSLLAFIAVAMIPTPWVYLRYGVRMRERWALEL
ncbi:hypothetical protein HYALB_00003112 [Hymenoscyphus albidus]|uniref:DDE-1 domain-containing protein n=1 Tax=Hymenoscyphus albidus TaxID=595503 RepID=A0A9N9LAG7_9HELO|nr:hypothetical protein HYALB_00003112 [Hymenoscyphus albidus]